MSLTEAERARARKAIVEEHIRCENLHDLEAMMATFGSMQDTMTSRGQITVLAGTECARITPSSCARYPISQLR